MSHYDQLIHYIAAKPEASAEYPFGPDVLVYKLCGKMFALVTETEGLKRFNLKCEPNHALELRSIFDAVKPGYHMNKKHWNSVLLDGSLPLGELYRMVDHSYSMVFKGLTKQQRLSLELRYSHEALHG
ncbi:MmcQ/YjbR family DNA-binding protein [Marinomonas fungiae]|uniref:Predicted DNA-binding protein with ?double-wing? structural motif, MmcQ/YjbR family n=1 Tax=Marinomonas fungiae TaxID=1137284 RepID=A0A0K6IHS1_9GAMM|nr:MmcQ/YjbR family DNA-binding protein [Marinomonas fungiae]CUB02650.1 Predicted DNA-binding protein with ?double-wing? structural motif, MmcQ/YjbR family [Marinomonas fungiae]